MKKQILLTLISSVFIIPSKAQLPSYIPSDSLVAFWLFNGNANDVSGNTHHGTANGASLTADRFGNPNQAYYFDGIDDYIEIESKLTPNDTNSFSINLWIKADSINTSTIISDRSGQDCGYNYRLTTNSDGTIGYARHIGNPWVAEESFVASEYHNKWLQITAVYQKDSHKMFLYLNGILKDTINSSIWFNGNNPTIIGALGGCNISLTSYFKGSVDDIGFWNRVLNQDEISTLYISCKKNQSFKLNPIPAINKSADSKLEVLEFDSGATLIWQTNPLNMGWVNILSNQFYSANANTLQIKNVQLQNHHQPVRVISKYNSCLDTSNIVNLIIADTCINTVYDTSFVSVTDTLIITTKTGVNDIAVLNTIKVYPNPASTHLHINNGDLAKVVGCSIRITNAAGQEVYNKPITEHETIIDLSEWNSKGLYILSVINNKGTVISTKKIILR